jgi:hypothetical protein
LAGQQDRSDGKRERSKSSFVTSFDASHAGLCPDGRENGHKAALPPRSRSTDASKRDPNMSLQQALGMSNDDLSNVISCYETKYRNLHQGTPSGRRSTLPRLEGNAAMLSSHIKRYNPLEARAAVAVYSGGRGWGGVGGGGGGQRGGGGRGGVSDSVSSAAVEVVLGQLSHELSLHSMQLPNSKEARQRAIPKSLKPRAALTKGDDPESQKLVNPQEFSPVRKISSALRNAE